MKRKRELILFLGVILLFFIIGTISGYPKSNQVTGKYVTGDPEEYLYIKKDGTFYLKEKGKYFHIVGAPETSGKWKVEKGEIIFSHPLGIITRWKIKPNVLIDEEGKTWFIEGSVPQSIRGVSKESVVGTYIDKGVDAELLIKPDGKYIYKRKGFSTIDGVWELNGNQIKLYPFMLIGSKKQKVEDPGLVMSGEIIGQVLQTTGGLRLVKQIGQPPVIQKPESSPLQTKEDLIAVLQELRDSMLFKIDTDIQNTAQAFTDVKGYWRAKRWADLARAPLRAIQHALSLVAKASDLSKLIEQLPKSFSQSQSIAELIALGMMVQSVKETGGKLSYAIHGPFYESSVEAMLKKADATQMPVSGFEPKYYKQVIENHLYGSENSPLIIPRKTITFPKKTLAVANGALQIKRIIMDSFKDLLSQAERIQLPASFPLDETVAKLREMKIKILNSTNDATKITYPIQKENGKAEVNLGCTGSLYRAFGIVSGNLAQNLRIQQKAEWSGLISTGADIIMLSVEYNVPTKEHVKIVQQVNTITQIMINGRKVLEKDPEEEFYMLPQAMLHSLPVELSHLLAISDSTVYYLRNLLNVPKAGPFTKTEKSYPAAPAPAAPSPTPSVKEKAKPAEAPTPASSIEAPRSSKYPETPEKVVEALYQALTVGNCSEVKKFIATDSLTAMEKSFREDGFQTFEQGCRETMAKSLSNLRIKITGAEIKGAKAVVSFEEYRKDGKLLNYEKADLVKEKGLWKIKVDTKPATSRPSRETQYPAPDAPTPAPVPPYSSPASERVEKPAEAPAPASPEPPAKPAESPTPAPGPPAPKPPTPAPQPPSIVEEIFKIIRDRKK